MKKAGLLGPAFRVRRGQLYSGDYRIRSFLNQSNAPKLSYAHRENRALFFKGTLFHETAKCRFADGFANRRRNLTMLFKKTAA